MGHMRRRDELYQILDEDQRISRWPRRRLLKEAALKYLTSKFQSDYRYSEPAVNALLRRWSAFDDPALLRRELYDRGYINRTKDGYAYWKVEQ